MLEKIHTFPFSKDLLEGFSNIVENYPITSTLYSISAKTLSIFLIKYSIPLSNIAAVAILVNSLILDAAIFCDFEIFEEKFNYTWQISFLPKIEKVISKIKQCSKKKIWNYTQVFGNYVADNTYRKVIKKISFNFSLKPKEASPKLLRQEYPLKDIFSDDTDEHDPAWIL